MPTSTQRFRLVGQDDASAAFLEVAAASRLLKSNIDDVNSSLFGLTKLVGGTSLVPVLAGTTAAVLELGTALTAASLSAGLFGLSAGGIVKDMLTQQKAIKVTQTSLSKLTKGSADYNSKLIELHAQQKAFNKEFGPAAKGYTDMGTAFTKFKDATSKVTTHVLGDAFEGIAKVLPKLVPVSNAAGEAIGGLIDEMVQGIDGPGFAHFLDFLETSGPRDITAFGHIIGHTIGGLGGIFSNFVGPGDHAAATLERLTKRFDTWGHSKGVSDSVDRFLRYVHDNGPEINATFAALGQAAPKIATALGQLGSLNLSLTSKFLTLLAGLPQKQFNLIADGLFAMAAGAKALTLVTGIGAVGKGLAGILAGKGLVGKGASVVGATRGVQHVWVDNPGFSKGGSDSPTGIIGKTGRFLEKKLPFGLEAGGAALTVGGALAIGSVAAITIGSAALSVKAIQLMSAPGKVDLPGQPTTTREALNANAERINNNGIGPAKLPLIPDIKAVGTAFQSMGAQAASASRQIDLIGPHAKNSNGVATKTVETLNGKMAAISGGKGSAAFDLIGHSAAKNTATAGRNVVDLSGKINHIPNKDVKVTANTSAAMAALLNIQAYQIRDKTFTVTRVTNATVAEHVKPGRGSGGGASSGSSSQKSAPSKVININVTAPVGSDAYTIGETLKQYLDEYEAASVS